MKSQSLALGIFSPCPYNFPLSLWEKAYNFSVHVACLVGLDAWHLHVTKQPSCGRVTEQTWPTQQILTAMPQTLTKLNAQTLGEVVTLLDMGIGGGGFGKHSSETQLRLLLTYLTVDLLVMLKAQDTPQMDS
ncbi:hypothetical protein DUI87_06715 [Hirundo rustica rustica]|uniref:Uncharacterized protein n=1 Tax=Hirundo rustica rustica TaxID=333673 RepID=A0A3M0KSY1_HIRRU|nr:hypothetical protein DUI87_06715 [Hirundo rustica rustica]